MRQRVVQHTLDGERLVNVLGGLGEAFHICFEKMIEGLPQHGRTAAAPLDELPPGRLGCNAVKDMLQRQVFMPTLFQLLHSNAQCFLQVLANHAPTSSSVQRRG